jgi:hypothetical protein
MKMQPFSEYRAHTLPLNKPSHLIFRCHIHGCECDVILPFVIGVVCSCPPMWGRTGSDCRNGMAVSQSQSVLLLRLSELLFEKRKKTLLIQIGHMFSSVQYVTVCQNTTAEILLIQRKTFLHKF